MADSTIITKISGDASGLVSALERGKALVAQFAATTAKSAAESADAFKSLFAAEDALAAQKKRAALEIGAGFKAEIILQREILELKQQVDAATAGSLQKLQLQLALSEKQLQLERQIAATRKSDTGYYTSTAKGIDVVTTKSRGFLGGLTKMVSVSNALKGAFSSLVGIGAAMFAPAIADRLARLITGFSKAQEEMLEALVEKTGKAADAQIAQLERVKKEFEDAEKERVSAIERTHNAYVEAAQEQNRLDTEAARERAERETKAGFAADLEWVKEQDRLAAEKKLKIAGIMEVKAAEIAAAEEVARVEQARIDEKFKSLIDQWTGFQMLVTTSGRGNEELTDEELQRKISTLRGDVFQRRSNQFSSGFNFNSGDAAAGGRFDPFLSSQQANLERTLAEKALRDKVRRDTDFFGSERAFEMNPGVTSTRFSQINNTETKLDRIAEELRKVNEKLKGGIPTLTVDAIRGG